MFLCFFYAISKITTFAAVYGDILCIVLSYIISSKLEWILANLEISLQVDATSTTSNASNIKQIGKTVVKSTHELTIDWHTLYKEIREIRKLTIETSKFLSPLLLISLMVDLFLIVRAVSLRI